MSCRLTCRYRVLHTESCMLLLNLTGKRIRRIKPDSVEFEDGTVIDLTRQDFEFFKLIKPMVWW